ncbi:MAG: hypothetical protein ACREXN_00445 [Polaromonas sp.]
MPHDVPRRGREESLRLRPSPGGAGPRAARPAAIVVAGERSAASALLQDLQRRYLPARVLAFAADVPVGVDRPPLDGQATAYLCRNRTCGAPVTDAATLVERYLKDLDRIAP